MSNQAKTFENTDSELDSLYALNEHQQVRLKTRIDVALKVGKETVGKHPYVRPQYQWSLV